MTDTCVGTCIMSNSGILFRGIRRRSVTIAHGQVIKNRELLNKNSPKFFKNSNGLLYYDRSMKIENGGIKRLLH